MTQTQAGWELLSHGRDTLLESVNFILQSEISLK